MSQWLQKQLVVDDTLINYYLQESKNSNTTVIVFLHGWRSDAMVWAPIAKNLSNSGFPIYSLDLPGFGKSEKPTNSLTLDSYMDLVKEFTEKLGIKKIFLVGHSFGGRVGIKLAVKKPELIKGLVLVNSAGLKKKSLKKSVLNGLAKLAKPFFAPTFMHSLRTRLYRIIGVQDYVARPELKETFVNIINEDLTDLLPRITSKTLIVWGRDDKEVLLADGMRMAKDIPNAKLEIIENAGHFSFLDKKEEFTNILSKFLNESN